ncbi:hypothetical protein [Streptomyces sp900116325]|uniref:hypothetical protein n=1 Tax=Streptomyces sp. 900116325 TaxID=3154295 RepID=UPI0033F3CB37
MAAVRVFHRGGWDAVARWNLKAPELVGGFGHRPAVVLHAPGQCRWFGRRRLTTGDFRASRTSISEGEGGLIADDLAGAQEIIIGLEWRDCLGFSGGGDLEVMQVSAQHLERYLARDNPEIAEERARVATALSLRVAPVADLVIQLQEAASRTERDYVVAEEGQAYGPPFGESLEPRHGGLALTGRIPARQQHRELHRS